MKTAEEILKNMGCIYHENGTPLYPSFNVLEAMKEYAIEVAKEALKNADKRVGMFPNYRNLVEDKILNESNIPSL